MPMAPDHVTGDEARVRFSSAARPAAPAEPATPAPAPSAAAATVSAAVAAPAARAGGRLGGALRTGRVLWCSLRPGLAVFQRGDRRRDLARPLLRAAVLPQLAELGVVVRVVGALDGCRASALVERLVK